MSGTDRSQDPKALWERRFAALRRRREASASPANHARWLAPWESCLRSSAVVAPVLDLGCGDGRDTQYLCKLGLDVIAADFSWEALTLTRQVAPTVPSVTFDIRQGLPFRPSAFGVIIASLVLHYFPWEHTVWILDEIRSRLKPDGHLLMRVNATDDLHYGASGYPEIEYHYYNVNGEPKRFFDRYDLSRLFTRGWQHSTFKKEIMAEYGLPKSVWVVHAQRD